jgi:hypothetical protein
MDWGLGYFKLKACDWCDDIAGETADITLGDAWLPQFQQDPKGHNILIVRHPELQKILNNAVEKGNISLTSQTPHTVFQSQAGNYRHRREGLGVRIQRAQQQGVEHPRKRPQPNPDKLSTLQKKRYLLRERMAEVSHQAFLTAKKYNRFSYFLIKMWPYQLYYYWLNKRLIKQSLVYTYHLIQYIKRKR